MRPRRRQGVVLQVLKAVLFLAVIAFIGLTGYAYIGDLSPDQAEIVKPVTLDVDQ